MDYITAVHAQLGRAMAQGGTAGFEFDYHLTKPNEGSRTMSLQVHKGGELASMFVHSNSGCNETVSGVHLPESRRLAEIYLSVIDTSEFPAKIPEGVQRKVIEPLKAIIEEKGQIDD